jgi:hypothetical protein
MLVSTRPDTPFGPRSAMLFNRHILSTERAVAVRADDFVVERGGGMVEVFEGGTLQAICSMPWPILLRAVGKLDAVVEATIGDDRMRYRVAPHADGGVVLAEWGDQGPRATYLTDAELAALMAALRAYPPAAFGRAPRARVRPATPEDDDAIAAAGDPRTIWSPPVTRRPDGTRVNQHAYAFCPFTGYNSRIEGYLLPTSAACVARVDMGMELACSEDGGDDDPELLARCFDQAWVDVETWTGPRRTGRALIGAATLRALGDQVIGHAGAVRDSGLPFCDWNADGVVVTDRHGHDPVELAWSTWRTIQAHAAEVEAWRWRRGVDVT